ncbi:DUF1289 domain-containing protein [Sphingomonas psychrotolerans]|uniref:DUF1289 domain-containing protein n=1 Tax=Sphingomonas psychrotolerans TaxID=1327635 RepID=A0A2K8MI34_9SPHN|nr:DUF1289 domain-containing protein [Sphingomonas psychrotolerans]ATY32654.1 DUF1289 domain-containing protein [Sphingomonas psychrotolerans]
MSEAAGAGSAPIRSPCTNICRIDDATGWCVGCGRTLDEIVRWGTTDGADRDGVMAQLPARMAASRVRRM